MTGCDRPEHTLLRLVNGITCDRLQATHRAARWWLRRVVWSIAAWIILAGFYLFFAGTVDTVEVASAVCCAGVAAGLGYVMARNAQRQGGERPRGAFGHQPFEPGGPDAKSRTRRAATIIGVSLAPRTFVVRGEDSKELLLHCLPEKAPSPDQSWPA